MNVKSANSETFDNPVSCSSGNLVLLNIEQRRADALRYDTTQFGQEVGSAAQNYCDINAKVLRVV